MSNETVAVIAALTLDNPHITISCWFYKNRIKLTVSARRPEYGATLGVDRYFSYKEITESKFDLLGVAVENLVQRLNSEIIRLGVEKPYGITKPICRTCYGIGLVYLPNKPFSHSRVNCPECKGKETRDEDKRLEANVAPVKLNVFGLQGNHVKTDCGSCLGTGEQYDPHIKRNYRCPVCKGQGYTFVKESEL